MHIIDRYRGHILVAILVGNIGKKNLYEFVKENDFSHANMTVETGQSVDMLVAVLVCVHQRIIPHLRSRTEALT